MNDRVTRLQQYMNGIDCLLLTSPEDIFFYSGYMPLAEDGSLLAVMEKGAKLFTTQNGFQVKKASVDIRTLKKAQEFYDFVKNYRVVGFDENSMLARTYEGMRKHGLEMVPSYEIIRKPRMVKDRGEVDRIRAAIALTKKALRTRIEGTEDGAAAKVDCLFRTSGASNAFETIVASGRNSSNVHHRPSDRKISRKDLVIVDLGAKLDCYCADLTRTFCAAPGKREKSLMETVKHVQESLFDFIKPGLRMSDVQKEYERLLKKERARCFHLFGHGVGLNVHESPMKDDELTEGMVITVEPGIYRKNFGGCRIEDMVLIKKEGIELLS